MYFFFYLLTDPYPSFEPPQRQLLDASIQIIQMQSQQLFDDNQIEQLLEEQFQQMYNEWFYDQQQ